MKKPDLLILVAIWQFLTAFFILAGIAIALLIFPLFRGDITYSWGGMDYRSGMIGGLFVLSVFILVLLCYLVLAVAGGIGLMLNKGHEWARIFSIIHSGLSLFAVPIGTVIGTLSIIYLTKQDVREYFSPSKESLITK